MFDDTVDPRYPEHPGRLSNRDDLRRMIDGYDTAVRYVDDQIGKSLAGWRKRGFWRKLPSSSQPITVRNEGTWVGL